MLLRNRACHHGHGSRGDSDRLGNGDPTIQGMPFGQISNAGTSMGRIRGCLHPTGWLIPASGCTMPINILISVDLPAPLRPRKP